MAENGKAVNIAPTLRLTTPEGNDSDPHLSNDLKNLDLIDSSSLSRNHSDSSAATPDTKTPTEVQVHATRTEDGLHLNGTPILRLITPWEEDLDPHPKDGADDLDPATLDRNFSSLISYLLKNGSHEDSEQDGQMSSLLQGMSGERLSIKDSELDETPLQIAVRRGLHLAVGALLRANAQILVPDEDGQLPLHVASRLGHSKVIKALLGRPKSGINSPDNNSMSPLSLACRRGHDDVVRLLLDADADTKLVDEDGWSPLHWASAGGHSGIVTTLLDKDSSNMNDIDILNKVTSLQIALHYDYEKVVRCLLDKGAKTAVGSEGETALTVAIRHGRSKSLDVLLQEKYELLDQANKLGSLIRAAEKGYHGVVQGLVNACANPNVANDRGDTALMMACRYRQGHVATYLLEELSSASKSKVAVDLQDHDGETALHKASYYGHTELVYLLLKHGAASDKSDKKKRTALHKASKQGYVRVVQALLKSNQALVHALDEDQRSALHVACSSQAKDAEEQNESVLGPEGKGDASSSDTESTQLASHGISQHREVIQALLEHEADAFLEDKFGKTTLCYGYESEYRLETMRSLLKKLKPTDKISFGSDAGDTEKQALQWATESEHTHDLARMILSKGAMWTEDPKNLSGRDQAYWNPHSWNTIEWATFRGIPVVLFRLLTAPSSTSLTHDRLKRALQIAKALAEDGKRAQGQDGQVTLETKNADGASLAPVSEERATMPVKPAEEGKLAPGTVLSPGSDEKLFGRSSQSESSARRSSIGGMHGWVEKRRERSEKRKIGVEWQNADRALILDLLLHPPFMTLSRQKYSFGAPKPAQNLQKPLESWQASIIYFYDRKDEDPLLLRRDRPVWEVLYSHGPESIMQKAKDKLNELKRPLQTVKGIHPAQAENIQYIRDTEKDHAFTWVHLPANNVSALKTW